MATLPEFSGCFFGIAGVAVGAAVPLLQGWAWWSLLPGIVVGFMVGWAIGSVLAYLIDVLIGLFRN